MFLFWQKVEVKLGKLGMPQCQPEKSRPKLETEISKYYIIRHKLVGATSSEGFSSVVLFM